MHLVLWTLTSLCKDGLLQHGREVGPAAGSPRLEALGGRQSQEAVAAGNVVLGEALQELLDEHAEAVGVPGAVVLECVGALLLLLC